jgi:hypothetical protein
MKIQYNIGAAKEEGSGRTLHGTLLVNLLTCIWLEDVKLGPATSLPNRVSVVHLADMIYEAGRKSPGTRETAFERTSAE